MRSGLVSRQSFRSQRSNINPKCQTLMLPNWKSYFWILCTTFLVYLPDSVHICWHGSWSKSLFENMLSWKHAFSWWWFSAMLKFAILNSNFNIFLHMFFLMHKIWITKIAYTPKIYGLDTKTSPIFERAYLFPRAITFRTSMVSICKAYLRGTPQHDKVVEGSPWRLEIPIGRKYPYGLRSATIGAFSVTKSFNDM